MTYYNYFENYKYFKRLFMQGNNHNHNPFLDDHDDNNINQN